MSKVKESAANKIQVESEFFLKLRSAKNEPKEVNPAYLDLFKKYSSKSDFGLGIYEIDSNWISSDGAIKCSYTSENGDEMCYVLLLECKMSGNYINSSELAVVLAQALFYAKRIHNDKNGSYTTPKVIVLGSKESCCIISLNEYLLEYLDKEFKSTRASDVDKYDKEIIKELDNAAEEGKIENCCYTFNYDDTSEEQIEVEKQIISRIISYAKGNLLGETITSQNIGRVFRDFINIDFEDDLSSKEKLEVLCQLLTESGKGVTSGEHHVFLTIKNTNDKSIIYRVSKSSWNIFSHLYNIESKIDRENFSSILSSRDAYLDEEERRRGGDFYTPKIWVEEGWKFLKEKLGETWKSDYVIWDCCCGTGNLTKHVQAGTGVGNSRCIRFISTLSEADIVSANVGNSGAYVFQYDFLNDDVDCSTSIGTWNAQPIKFNWNTKTTADAKSKQVSGVLKNFENRKLYKAYSTRGKYLLRLLISGYYSESDTSFSYSAKEKKSLLFLINPPYASAQNFKEADKAKTGVNDSLIKEDILKNSSIEKASENLYSQFFYRILCMIKQFRNCDIAVACYVKSTFLTGDKCEDVREAFAKEGYIIDGGFNFKGSEFAGCSDEWSLTFCLIRRKKEAEQGSMNEYNFIIKERVQDENVTDKKSYRIIDAKTEDFYSLEKEDRLSTYVRPVGKYESYDAPALSSSLSLSKGQKKNRGNIIKDTLGYLVFNSNCVDKSKYVFGLSSCAYMAHGFNILSSNYDKAIVGFVARKLIKPDWTNQRKEFMKPNEAHEKFDEFKLDSYILGMFIDGASWSSLRNFKYESYLLTDKSKSRIKLIGVSERVGCVERIDDVTYNVYNEFFWMSKESIMKLLDESYITKIEADCENDTRSESFTYANKILPNLNKFSSEAKLVLDLATKLVEQSFKYRMQAIKANADWHLEAWDAGWYQIKKLIESDFCKSDEELQKTYQEFKAALKVLQTKNIPLVYELGFLK